MRFAAEVNPKRGDVYDIDIEQLRAQGQAIYESYIQRLFDVKWFRDPETGRRLDADIPRDTVRELVATYVFAVGTGVGQRTGFIEPGTRRPTLRAVDRSRERTQPGWADKLLRNRQDYEETLALARRSGAFYRVVPEHTVVGIRYFVWPLPPGTRIPTAFSSEASAQRTASELNTTRDPTQTDRWWMPPRLAYSPTQLTHWLPPATSTTATARSKTG